MKFTKNTKPKQSDTIYRTQLVTTAMVTSHLQQILVQHCQQDLRSKDNFCEFTYKL